MGQEILEGGRSGGKNEKGNSKETRANRQETKTEVRMKEKKLHHKLNCLSDCQKQIQFLWQCD